jgi:hypothetical protein
MSNHRWVVECVIFIVIAGFFLGAIWLFYCLMRSPSDACAYTVADWVCVLLQYAVFGAFGGFLTLLSRLDQDDAKTTKKKADATRQVANDFSYKVFVSSMGGIGGAYAYLFFLVYDDKLTEINLTELQMVKNCVSGVVAGFLGFALLRRIADSVDNKARADARVARRDAEQAKKVSETTSEDMKSRDELEASVRYGKQRRDRLEEDLAQWRETPEIKNAPDLLDRLTAKRKELSNTLEFQEDMDDLREKWEANKDHRSAAIVLSNMYADRGDYNAAVQILNETIPLVMAKTTLGSTRERRRATDDYLDLRWDRANNYAMLVRYGPAADRDANLQKMYDDVEVSLAQKPENVRLIDVPDEWFGNLVDAAKFKNLIETARQQADAKK